MPKVPETALIRVSTYWLMLLAALAAASIAAVASSGALADAEFWLNRYQTLVAGVFALVAGVLGFRGVQAQISATERIEMERREREAASARSILPLALAQLTTFVQETYVYLRREERLMQIPGHRSNNRPPPLPSGVIDVLRENIRSDKNTKTEEMVILIQQIQYLMARVASIHINRNMLGISKDDAVGLHARLASMFEYARGGILRPYKPEDHRDNSQRLLDGLRV